MCLTPVSTFPPRPLPHPASAPGPSPWTPHHQGRPWSSALSRQLGPGPGQGLLTRDQDVQGGAGGRPRVGEDVPAVSSVPAPMGAAHTAQGEVRALLPF